LGVGCTDFVTDDCFTLFLGERLASIAKMSVLTSAVDFTDDGLTLVLADRLRFRRLSRDDLADDSFVFLPVERLAFLVGTPLLKSGVDFTDDGLTILLAERLGSFTSICSLLLLFFASTSLLTSGASRETLDFGDSWSEITES